MKNNRITPVGLKGQQINERMKELMGIKSINENQSNVVVELTKMGPDGNAYAIIRENHEWYIKKTTKTSNLIAEDFKYIGGLMNKKDEAYPSYAKAIKHLNLKFKSLAEAYNFEGEINVFENDNLISENMPSAGGFSEMKGNGFSGKGNNEGQQSMWEEEEEEEELSEAEKAIDEMMTREELKGNQSKLDMNKNGKLDADDFKSLRAGKKGMEEEMSAKEKSFAALAEPKDKITYADKIAGAKKGDVKESKLSISEAIKNMDRLIDTLTEGLKKKV
jgi:hypothetical protein